MSRAPNRRPQTKFKINVSIALLLALALHDFVPENLQTLSKLRHQQAEASTLTDFDGK